MKPGTVYVVAIQQNGGPLMTTGMCYFEYEDAKKKLDLDRRDGISYTKIFTLHENKETLERERVRWST